MNNSALYAGSFDPIHWGHIDVIRRARKLFGNVVVAVGNNPSKKYTFTIGERIVMIRNVLDDEGMQDVVVTEFDGLLVSFADENKIPIIVRGLRDAADFDYEKISYCAGKSQDIDVETVMLFASQPFYHISSGAVKEIVRLNGRHAEKYVPMRVKQALEKRINGQIIFGLTGEMGVGKSFIGEKLVEIGKQYNIPVYNIDLDSIGHKVLSGNVNEPIYQEARKQIIEKFHTTEFDNEEDSEDPLSDIGFKLGRERKKTNILNVDGSISRKKLGKLVFANESLLKELNRIMIKPIMMRLSRVMAGKKGIILLNSALLVEANMLDLCNNNVIVVQCNVDKQYERLEKRGYDGMQIRHRLDSAYNLLLKTRGVSLSIDKYKYGKTHLINNSENENDTNLNEFVKNVFVPAYNN